MKNFRFVILGAGGIGNKFCKAVSLLEQCEVSAVASKSAERAKSFAEKNGVPAYYDSYEEALDREKPDCAYIAVTPNDHYRLTMLCIERGIPVLCEKAMFRNSSEAEAAFDAAGRSNVFVMEALWSRFLPAVRKARQWVAEGRIGLPEIAQCSIGFAAPEGRENRYFNPDLGGGAAKDITVYGYALTTYILNQKVKRMAVSATWGDTGVDINNHISMDFTHTLADIAASFVTRMEERMVIYGKGKIVLPHPHFASECFLYDEKGELEEHFRDEETENGFTYEIQEVIRCIREGKQESAVMPWRDTLDCARLFDKIEETACEASHG